MKIARLARNVLVVALAWRLIARRRQALARERRARRIAPLLVAAGGTAVILAARPRILEVVRRLWDVVRRQLSGKTSTVVSKPQRDALDRSQEREQEPLTLAETEPNPRVKKRRKRVARAQQSEKGKRKSAYGIKAEGKKRSEPGAEMGDPLKH